MSDEIVVGWHVPGPPEPESRFREPTARCPFPERWSATDADSTELEVGELLGALVRALQPDLVVETGAAFGSTTAELVRALERNGHGFLVALETNPERAAYVRDRIVPTPAWELVEESSLTWAPGVLDPPIGLIFTDTARDLRVDEIVHFRPYLRAGSIVAVHDSAWDAGPLRGWIENSLVMPGIVRAIDLPTPRGLTLCEVR